MKKQEKQAWIETPLGQIYGGENDVRAIIAETVNATVVRLKFAGLLKTDRKTATEKLEELLRNYPAFKQIKGRDTTERLVANLEAALRTIEDDPYFDVIRRFYFEGETRESIALDLNTTVTTISRNKTRLLKALAPRIFSEEVIAELFS